MVKNQIYQKIKFYSEILLSIITLHSIVVILIILGFYVNYSIISALLLSVNISIYLFVTQEILRLFFSVRKLQHLKERWFEFVFSAILLTIIFTKNNLLILIEKTFPNFTQSEILSFYLTLLVLLVATVLLIKSVRYLDSLLKLNLHPAALFAISFALIILTGAIFLTLPKATVSGESTSFVDALFTSTSAVCVTGLVVQNTATHFSTFGQIIILILIQIGGLGVMTLTTFFAVVVGGGLSVRVRMLMKDYLNQLNMGSIGNLIIRIFLFTISIEFIGATILFFSTYNTGSNLMQNIYFSIFHSVSAFCNAGFSIYPNGLVEDVVVNNYTYLSTIMFLIVLGGLGFTVLMDIRKLIFYRKKNFALFVKNNFSLNSKIVLSVSILLIFGGTLIIYLTHQPVWKSDHSILQNLFHSLFMSITTRTAGFNTIAVESIAIPAAFIVIFLMWIGASPNSTGGGIKTTTFAITSVALLNQIRGKDRMELFKKEIDQQNINTAFMVLIANIISLSIGIFILLIIEPSKQPFDLVFEAVSAASTVGLSRNITPFLSEGGKVLIILLMFIGRVGFLNFFMAFYKPNKEPNYHYTKENIMVG